MRKNINKKEKIGNTKVRNYIKFYKKYIGKKHIICSLIFLILFIIFLILGFNKDIQTESMIIPTFFNSFIKQKALASFIIIFAGIVPYFYMSILGLAFSSELAMAVVSYYKISSSIPGLIANIFGAILVILAYSHSIAVGIYYCSLSTKRFKYNQGRGFSFLDVKRSIANLRRNEEKIKLYNDEEEKRRKKIEEFNVKVDYKNIVISYLITVVILFIATIFIR